MKTLRGYFSGAAGLTYSKNIDKYSVEIDDDDALVLVPQVQEYDVYYPEPIDKMQYRQITKLYLSANKILWLLSITSQLEILKLLSHYHQKRRYFQKLSKNNLLENFELIFDCLQENLRQKKTQQKLFL